MHVRAYIRVHTGHMFTRGPQTLMPTVARCIKASSSALAIFWSCLQATITTTAESHLPIATYRICTRSDLRHVLVPVNHEQVEGVQSAADAEVIELADDAEKERLAKDPLYRLEQGEASRKRARSEAERVADLKV